jgi:opacity protein-like surface antigen
MRSLLVSSACAASLMLALAPAASAADVDYAPEPVGPTWYVSVFGGWSLPDNVDISFNSTAGATDVEFSGDIDLHNGFLAGAAIGGHINDWIRGEVEVSGHWHDAGGDATLTISSSPSTPFDVDGDANALFVLADLWLELPIDEATRPYVGGGVGMGRLDLELEGTAAAATVGIIDDSDWGFAFQLGAGVALDITHNLTVDVGYRFKRINNAELELDTDVTNNLEADDKVDYTSHNVLLGLRIGF